MDWSEIEFFGRDEFRYDGETEPCRKLVRMLDSARRLATERAGRDVPFTITSAIRPPRQTREHSSHVTGHAVDIRAWQSRDRFYILEALFAVGFNRIGIYDRHIHVDTSSNHDPDVVWMGESE